MDIWKAKASGPLHLIHLGYGVGGFIVPKIVAPFITDKIATDVIVNPLCVDFNQSHNLNQSGNTTTPTPQPSDTVQYGFLIVSGIIVAIAGIWLFYFFCDKSTKESTQNQVVKDKTTIREIFNLNTCAPGHPFYAFILYVLMFFWIFIAVVGERVFAKYLYSYAREQACFSKDNATTLLTAFWISFTVGRFAGFVGAFLVPMKVIIFVEGIGNFASAIVLYFFSSNEYVLWICVCISGLMIGPCYPSGLAWANRYIVVTATGVTVLSVGAGVSDLSFLSTIGYFVEKMGVSVMTTFVLGYGVLVCVFPIIMQSVACTRGDRFEREDQEREDDNQH